MGNGKGRDRAMKEIKDQESFYETYSENEKLSTLWSVLPWSQNRAIFSKCKTEEERMFYLNFQNFNCGNTVAEIQC